MKILFLITYYTPYISGLTLYAKRLAEALAKRGHNCSVLTVQYDDSLAREEEIGGVSICRVPYLFKISKGFILPLWPFISFFLLMKHDTVIINLPQAEAVITATLARLLGKHIISIYHCDVSLPPGFFNKTIQLLLDMSSYITLLLSDSVVNSSLEYANYSRVLPYFKKKLTIIYPPIPEQFIQNRTRRKSKIFTVGFAGRIASEKGLEYLLEALKMVKLNIRLIISGPAAVGEEQYQNTIEQRAKKYGNAIQFLGVGTDADMKEFYRTIDILVLPSVNATEAFGMVQVEAMLAGVPVVASDMPGVRIPIQKTGMGILVPPRDPEELARAIETIAQNPGKYTRSHSAITKHFSFTRSLRAYERLALT